MRWKNIFCDMLYLFRLCVWIPKSMNPSPFLFCPIETFLNDSLSPTRVPPLNPYFICTHTPTLNIQYSILNTQHPHTHTQYSILNTPPSTLNTQHSTLISQHSTPNTQHPTLNTQHSTLNTTLTHSLRHRWMATTAAPSTSQSFSSLRSQE